jgi:hypothetical protein
MNYLEVDNRLVEVYANSRIKSDDMVIKYRFMCFELYSDNSDRPIPIQVETELSNVLSYEDAVTKYPEYFI